MPLGCVLKALGVKKQNTDDTDNGIFIVIVLVTARRPFPIFLLALWYFCQKTTVFAASNLGELTQKPIIGKKRMTYESGARVKTYAPDHAQRKRPPISGEFFEETQTDGEDGLFCQCDLAFPFGHMTTLRQLRRCIGTLALNPCKFAGSGQHFLLTNFLASVSFPRTRATIVTGGMHADAFTPRPLFVPKSSAMTVDRARSEWALNRM